MAINPRAIFTSFSLLFLVSPLCCMAKDLLYSGQSLKSGESITAGSFAWVMQEDCNWVLFENGKPGWSSNTAGLGQNCYLTFETNANIDVFDGNHKLLFQIVYDLKEGNYVLILQENGYAVIYGPKRWLEETKLRGGFGSDLYTSFGALPANKNAEKAKAVTAARITMVVSN